MSVKKRNTNKNDEKLWAIRASLFNSCLHAPAKICFLERGREIWKIASNSFHHLRFSRSYHSHLLHHGGNGIKSEFKIVLKFCLFPSSAQLTIETMQFHSGFYCLFMKILSGDIFPSLAIHFFYVFFFCIWFFSKGKKVQKGLSTESNFNFFLNEK